MIYIEKNFLDIHQCNNIIQLYKKLSHLTKKHRDTFPLCLFSEGYFEEYLFDFPEVIAIINKIEQICLSYNDSIKFDTCEIVKWPIGSKMNPHFDPPGDVFACLVYLNDDYSGGKTCFENFEVIPEIGSLVIFSNNTLLHWVEEIKDSDRYTLALWFIEKC